MINRHLTNFGVVHVLVLQDPSHLRGHYGSLEARGIRDRSCGRSNMCWRRWRLASGLPSTSWGVIPSDNIWGYIVRPFASISPRSSREELMGTSLFKLGY